MRVGAERNRRELEVLVKLAAPLMATAGYAAPEVEAVFERAHALSRAAAPGRYHAPLLRGIVSFQQVRGEHRLARFVGEEMLALCADGADQIASVQAHYGHGVTLYDLLEHEAAARHLTIALAKYDPATHPTHVTVYGGYDPGVGCCSWLAWVHWYRGAPDQAWRYGAEGLALAERLEHPFSIEFACSSLALVHLQRGEVKAATTLIDRGLRICDADGFEYQGAVLRGLLGWARLLEGRIAEGLGLVVESIAIQERTGAGVGLPGFLNVLGNARWFSGDLEGARAAIDAGISAAERTGQALHLPLLHRTRGRLLVAVGDDPAIAEAAHRRGLEVATSSGSTMLELEAATGLAQHLLSTGRAAEAHAVLAPLVGRLTEGEGTRPVQEAQAILAAAAESAPSA